VSEEREYSVTQILPCHGQKVKCWGHKTFCCKEDMDEEADWHEVTFQLEVCCYEVKQQIPLDPEETILANYQVHEYWEIEADHTEGQVIGVTKWKGNSRQEKQ
jgi:hypothetical protein